MVLGFLSTRAAGAAIYYVSPSGDDGAEGSSIAPWRTLQRAANAVAAGDSVVVQPGTYPGFYLGTSGTSANRISFMAQPGVLINQPNPVNSLDGINLEGASYVTIDGFSLVGSNNPSTTRAGIRIVGSGDVAQRLQSRRPHPEQPRGPVGEMGHLQRFAEDLTIQNNEASRSAQQHGIYVSNSADRPIVRGNKVWGNAASGIQLNADLSTGNPAIPGVDGIISGAVIETNVIYGNGGGSVFTAGGGSAINLDGVQDSRIQNNLLYDNHASGISLFQIDGGDGSKNDVVANNTIVQAADSRWAVNIVGGTSPSSGDSVFNNILYNARSNRGSISIDGPSLAGFTSDYNAVVDLFSNDGGNSAIPLLTWRSQTGQDAHSFLSDPSQLFADPANNDYHLKPGSPALDAGVASFGLQSAPAGDLDGNTRPQGAGWDVGAYEGAVPEPEGVAAVTLSLALLCRHRRSKPRRP